MLVDGKWSEAWRPVQSTDAKGGFVRQISSFPNWVTPDVAAGPFPFWTQGPNPWLQPVSAGCP